MKAYEYIRKSVEENLKSKLIDWRKSNAITRLEKPTDIGKARILGYKDKKGFVIVRVRLKRGGHKRTRPSRGRRSARQSTRKNLVMNYRWIAEYRAGKKYENLEVLNSYEIAKDSQNYFFEVILIDPEKQEIKSDKNINWICKPKNRGRAFRGLTSAGKKARGLRA